MFKLAKENTKIALISIRSQLLRTFITVFIIAIGIFSLVGILSVVSALKNTILDDFSSMGANTFTLERYDFSSKITKQNTNTKPNPIITYSEAKLFKDNFDFLSSTTSISFVAASNIEVKHEGKKTDPRITIIGTDENYLHTSGLKIELGRDFSNMDISHNNNVCIIGSEFTDGLFNGKSPIDKIISIRGVKFKVIGVLKEKGSTFGINEDLRIMIPIQIAQSIFSQAFINYDIKTSISQSHLMNVAIEKATLTMRNIRKLPPSKPINFGIERSDSLIKTLLKQINVISMSAWIIGVITILGSSIALMNIMLVSVTERTREIGIRKSLGAKRNTIAWQFFTETLIIGQLGGLLGTILGISTGYIISIPFNFIFSIPWTAISAAIVTTLIVTIISGLYPAIKAAKLDPIEALRYE